MPGALIYDLLIILTSGLIAGLLCRWLRVSVLVGYLLVGAIVGNGGLGWLSDDQGEIVHIAEAGVFLLLFSIGLEFSLGGLVRLGRNLAIGGSVQMLLVALPVALILIAVGLHWQPAILIAAAVSFSSTVLVFKALAEWGHSSLPHGRRAIGILLFQDAALIPILLLVPLLTGTGAAAGPFQLFMLAITSAVFVLAIVILRRLVAKWIIPVFAIYRSPDLVVLFAVVLLGGITLAAYKVGLPPAVGAFAAGLACSGNRWTKQIDALILPFRETFAAVFFVSLGLLFDARTLLADPLFSVACFVGLLGIKAAAATIALRLTGLQMRSAAGMGIGLAHVGEFAFVLVLFGWEAGVIAESDYRRIVALAIGSLILTPLLLRTGLRWPRLSNDRGEEHSGSERPVPAGRGSIVVGAGPVGCQAASWLDTAGKDVCLVDLSPVNLHAFAQQGIRTIAGNAMEREVLDRAHIDDASVVVICIPDDDAAVQVVRKVRTTNSTALVVVRCRYRSNRQSLTNSGANVVVSEEDESRDAILRFLNEFDASNRPRG